MVRLFSRTLVLAVFAALAVHSQDVQILRQFGTSAADRAFAVATYAGFTYVAGTTAGSFAGSSNAGSRDAFVRKLFSNGGLHGDQE